MPGAGCDDMAAAGSEGRRGVRMSLRFGAATVDAILADVLCDVFVLPQNVVVVDRGVSWSYHLRKKGGGVGNVCQTESHASNDKMKNAAAQPQKL